MPQNDQTANARRVFMEIADLSKDQREDAITRQCGEDAALRAEVESLLAAHDSAGGAGFMNSPTAAAMPTADMPAGGMAYAAGVLEMPGTRIGAYKLLQLIGEGGFGSVFMAEQEKPVSRRVALKIIKLGMDTRQVVARFEQERQALAIMDHPNIAKVLDAGATDTGRPFFVMELVKGDPIVEYCDRNTMSIEARLELFAQVCNAVQHAHTKGIIHRDIKPSNVLVSTQDGKAHAKVIDFGIAKATQSKLTEKTLFTEHRQLIGTPEYMSPEQAEGSMDIDTRTDVYSLGVLLYELLTGSTPFSSRELRSVAYAEIQRIIREVDPPKPSTRLSDNSDTLASVAAKRQIEPKRLGTVVRGELDWIVMKALEKDRQRRYESPSDLGAEIRRYLNGEAVIAAPPGAVYRLRKFVRRNKGPVAAGVALGVSLLAGIVGTTWQARIAYLREQDAIRAGQEAIAARDAERARAAELTLVSDFQGTMLTQLDPRIGGRRLTDDVIARYTKSLESSGISDGERVRELDEFRVRWGKINATDVSAAHIDDTILKPAVQEIDRTFAKQPVVNAQLRQAVANVYASLGLYDQALPLIQAALATRRKELGEDHPDTLNSLDRLCNLLVWQRKIPEAATGFRETLERRRRTLGEEHPDTLGSLGNMGVVAWAEGDLAKTETIYRDVVEKMKRVLGPEDKVTLKFATNLGLALKMRGKYGEAETVVRDALDVRRRVLGNEHPETVDSIMMLSTILAAERKMEEADVLYKDALESSRRVWGEEHPDTLRALDNYANFLMRQKKYAAAEASLRDVISKSRRSIGADNPDTLQSVITLGRALNGQRKFSESLALLTSAEADARRSLTGGFSSRLSIFLRIMANARTGPGFNAEEFRKAEALLIEASNIAEAPGNATEKQVRSCLNALADLYGTWDRAEPGKGYGEKSEQFRQRAQKEPQE